MVQHLHCVTVFNIESETTDIHRCLRCISLVQFLGEGLDRKVTDEADGESINNIVTGGKR